MGIASLQYTENISSSCMGIRAKKRNVRPIDVLESDNFMGKAVAVSRQMIEQVKESN